MATKTLSVEDLTRLFEGQVRSTDMWLAQWEKYKDRPAAANAALAIGKLFGVYSVIVAAYYDENVPEELTVKMKHYSGIWDQLR